MAFQNTNDRSLFDAFDFTDTGTATFVNVFESTDGGQTWRLLGYVQVPGFYRDIVFNIDANGNVAAFICNGDWNFAGPISL